MPPEEPHRITITLDRLLEARGLTMKALAEKVGITPENLSVFRNGRARAVRFTTLTSLCDVLDCQPGDILVCEKPGGPGPHQDAR